MKQITCLFSLVLILSLDSCTSSYLPFKTAICDNTFCFNTRYKTELTLIEMAEILKKRSLNVERDTFYGKNRKWYRTSLKISDYKIDTKEIAWIEFSVFEPKKVLIFYGFCLEKPLIGTKKEIKAQSKAIKENIEKDVVPLLVE